MKSSILKPDSAKKNFVFQFFYQCVVLVLPLIVSPYLTRTLGSSALGSYTYTYSIAYYFVMAAMLGINKYGQRVIAGKRENINELRTTFWSLYVVHLICSMLVLVCYVIYVSAFCKSDVNVAAAQTLYVFSAVLDITWLFYGLEKFKIVAIRNALIRVLDTICIFCFVKEPSDIVIYTVIMGASTCLGYFVMLPQVIREIKPVGFHLKDMKEHIKPMLVLFAAAIASSLYTMFDKTLLGILSNKDNVAFYEYSNKIITIPRTFITIIGTVLYPRACVYAAKNDFADIKKSFETSLIVTFFIGFAAIFGLAGVAELFSVIYYGEAFAACGNIMICMSPLILIIGIGEAVRMQYIYPLKKDGMMVKILFTNAAVNLILTFILIPKIGTFGAVAGSIAAELTGLILETFICRKYIKPSVIFKAGVPFAIIGFVMYICIRIVSCYINDSVAALLIQIGAGAACYLFLSFVYGMFFNKTIREMIKSAAAKFLKK